MAIYLATKTVNAINAALEADQGASFRGWLGKVLPHIGDAYRTDEDGFRSHMGASGIGGECPRAIWYSFRWSKKPKFPGRMLRLFNRGHLEEGRFIALLLMIGCEVFQQDENGKQFRISASRGHYGGSGDGIVRGIPDLDPGTLALCEFKTHNNKSFSALVEEGVRASKFEHFVQCQQYMRKMGYGVTLYMAVNKDNDELYAELVLLDTAIADQFLDRADKLIASDAPPKRISESPGFYRCKFFCSDYVRMCHFDEAPHKTCRSCKYVQVADDAQWVCRKPAEPVVVDKERQLIGCEHYERLF